jgi:hypothetical protein
MNLLNAGLYIVAGILLNMSLAHLANYAETIRHRLIARTASPKVTSTLWGILQLFLGALILLWLKYKFELSLDTFFLFLGFSVWAVFLSVIADRLDKAEKKRPAKEN